MFWLWQLEFNQILSLPKAYNFKMMDLKQIYFYKHLKKMSMLLEMLLHIHIGILDKTQELNIIIKLFIKALSQR
jgi:hypothetical protein